MGAIPDESRETPDSHITSIIYWAPTDQNTLTAAMPLARSSKQILQKAKRSSKCIAGIAVGKSLIRKLASVVAAENH
jgi:hypothetical protein